MTILHSIPSRIHTVKNGQTSVYITGENDLVNIDVSE